MSPKCHQRLKRRKPGEAVSTERLPSKKHVDKGRSPGGHGWEPGGQAPRAATDWSPAFGHRGGCGREPSIRTLGQPWTGAGRADTRAATDGSPACTLPHHPHQGAPQTRQALPAAPRPWQGRPLPTVSPCGWLSHLPSPCSHPGRRAREGCPLLL